VKLDVTFEECTQRFTTAKSRASFLATLIGSKKEAVETTRGQIENLIKARWFITEAAKITQMNFKKDVESLVTMAVRSIFPRPFEFSLVFERKRNKLECRLVVFEKGHELDPKKEMGGSIVDVISFSMRIVLHTLERPRCRPVIILDEPMKNMGRLISLGGQVLREVSHELGFQLIINSHDRELIDVGDKVFEVTHDGTKSIVSVIKEEGKRISVEPVLKRRKAQ